jgi:hypothetical protein
MDEILALFPRGQAVLINFFTTPTRGYQDDIFRAKTFVGEPCHLGEHQAAGLSRW